MTLTLPSIPARLLVCALVLTGLVGCKAGSGDACKEEDDCGGGLTCCKPGSATSTSRGTCLAVCEVDDASIRRDAGTSP